MDDVTAIVPVKPWGLAKARLDVNSRCRERLTEAFSRDVLLAVASAHRIGHIVLVTAESGLRLDARALDATLLVDRPLLSSDGLNEAVGIGLAWARSRRPGHPVVVVPADLPCVTGDALDALLRGVSRRSRPTFVVDRPGTGTTVCMAKDPSSLRVAYGGGSAARHFERGMKLAPGIVHDGLRANVDSSRDLVLAGLIGVGPHTTAAVDALQAGWSAGVGARSVA